MGFRSSAAWLWLSNLPFTRHLTLNMGLFCLVLGLNVLSNGFDIAIYNTLQAMSAFQQTFGDECNLKGCHISTTNLSLLNSIPFIPYAVALLAASLIGERFGRRAVYVIMNIICLVGVAVSYTATSYGQILAGRSIINIYTGMESWLIPLYLAEAVPTEIRGTLVSCYTFFRLAGSLIISLITWHTAKFEGNSSWKVPLGALFSVPAAVLLCTPLIVESPRWLIRKGKDEDAVKALKYMNDGREGFDADDEISTLKQSLALYHEEGSWLELFKGVNRRRTNIAMLTQFFSLACGQSFANIYGTIFVQTLDVIDTFLYNVIIKIASILGALMFLILVDRIGRRRFWQTNAPLASVAMFMIGILGLLHQTRPIKLGIIAMLPIYGFFYIGSFAQLGALTPAEIPSPHLRDKTAMMAWSVQNLTNFVTTFTVPYLIDKGYGNLSSKVGLIYGALGFVACVWAFFFYPELKGCSLEEIDIMFHNKVPARKMKDWKAPPPLELEEKSDILETNCVHAEKA